MPSTARRPTAQEIEQRKRMPRFEQFLSELGDLAKASQESYRRSLLRLFKAPSTFDARSVTADEIRKFYARNDIAALAQPTRNVMLIALRRYLDFLIAQGIRRDNPAKDVRLQRAPDRLPRPLSRGSVAQLLNGFPYGPLTLVELQDRAIIETLYGSGLRRSEAATMTLAQITPTQLRVIGKGDKERVTIVTERGYLALRDWLVAYYRDAQTERIINCAPLGADAMELAWQDIQRRRPADPVFVTASGQPMRNMQDPGHYIWLRVQAIEAATGIKFAPHQLRHSFATHILGNGADILALRDVLGHQQLSTTEVYTLLDEERLGRLRLLHPRTG